MSLTDEELEEDRYWGLQHDRLYSVKEAAHALFVTEKTIRHYLAQRLFPGDKDSKGRWTIKGRGLIQFGVELGFDREDQLSLEPLIVLPSESSVVEVAFGFQSLLALPQVDRADLLALSPIQFEELVADLWRRFGYAVELTARTRDGGRDIIALRKSEAELRFLIECKRYSAEHKVGVALVRALFGVKTDEKATKAILATTSSFTASASALFERHRWELEPRDYNGVIEWIALAKRRNVI